MNAELTSLVEALRRSGIELVNTGCNIVLALAASSVDATPARSDVPVSADEASRALGVSTVSLLRKTHLAHDPAPCNRVGRRVSFDLVALKAWSRRQPPLVSRRRRKPIALVEAGSTAETIDLSGSGLSIAGGCR